MKKPARKPRPEVVGFLREALAGGAMNVRNVMAAAWLKGFHRWEVRWAKVRLGIETTRIVVDGLTCWRWELPEKPKRSPRKKVPARPDGEELAKGGLGHARASEPEQPDVASG